MGLKHTVINTAQVNNYTTKSKEHDVYAKVLLPISWRGRPEFCWAEAGQAANLVYS